MSTHMISVDWLQVHCSLSSSTSIVTGREFSSDGYVFTAKVAPIHTAMFQNVYYIFKDNIQVAMLQNKPRSTQLHKDMCILKLENRVLYHAKFIRLLYAVMSAFKLTYKGITRLDVCYDCAAFKDNRSPSKFINDFVSFRGITTHNLRKKGSEEFTCHGRKPRGGSSKINYIRFGSPQSKISSYIYDKTLELEESKDKPWIRAAWEKNGLLPTEKHIFRAEISIKAEGSDILNMATGELFRLSPDMLESQEKINEIFYIYAKKYFDFRVDDGQKYKKNFKRIELFDLTVKTEIKPIQINKSADTGRIEKICFNVLERLSSTYTDLSECRRTAIHDTQVFLLELQGIKSQTAAKQLYSTYLNSLKATMFSDRDFNVYMDALEQQNIDKKELVKLYESQSEWEGLPILEPYYPNEVSLKGQYVSNLESLIEYDSLAAYR
jgi:hypothetical protein